MNKKQVNQWAKDQGIDLQTVSFYSDSEGNECEDTEFTTCDITGEKGSCVRCIALDRDGNVIEFEVLETLVGGALGKAAGAF